MEAGCGWIPFVPPPPRQGVHRAPARGAAPPGAPSHYIKRFFYGTQPIEEPERLGDIVKLYELFDGENQAMFASTGRTTTSTTRSTSSGLPFSGRARRKIMGRERDRFFGPEVA
jgi:hypothetical protein